MPPRPSVRLSARPSVGRLPPAFLLRVTSLGKKEREGAAAHTHTAFHLAMSLSGRKPFIVFEGLDRSGKSTLSRWLVDTLRQNGFEVEHLRFPDRTSPFTGHALNSLLTNKGTGSTLNDEAVHLLFSANRWEAKHKIESSLAEGKIVVCDRYAHSGVAYSVAKGLGYTWCLSSDNALPAPDCVVFLDIDPEVAARERPGYGKERYEDVEFQRLVQEVYMDWFDEPYWQRVDAAQDMEHVQQEVQCIVTRLIQEMATQDRPMERLWATTAATAEPSAP